MRHMSADVVQYESFNHRLFLSARRNSLRRTCS
jgi:hypothetical protein